MIRLVLLLTMTMLKLLMMMTIMTIVVLFSDCGKHDEHASGTEKYQVLEGPSKDQAVLDSHTSALVR